MNCSWPNVRIGEIAEVTSSKRIKRADYVESGVPFFRSKEVIERAKGNDISTELYITEEQFTKIKAKFGAPEAGDILLSSVGTIGVPYQVKAADRFYFKDGNLTWFRRFKDCVEPEFLLYWLQSPSAQRKLDEVSIGSTQRALTIIALKSLEVPLPPKHVQREIVQTLSLINNKLGINRRANHTLEKIAQAIFKSWFVDFEPVKAKITARERWNALQTGYEPASPVCYAGELDGQPIDVDLDTYMNLAAMQAISGKDTKQLAQMQVEQAEEYAELCATAELFPSSMQDSELGEIPEGWSPVTVEYYLELLYGKALKKTARVEGQFPVYGSGGVTGSHNQALVAGPGIIVGRKGTVGSIYWESRDFYPIDTTYYVAMKNGTPLIFAHYLLQTLGLEDMNTDAAVPGLNRNNVYRLEVPYYPDALIERFCLLANTFALQSTKLLEQTTSLAEIRDTLLPKLLSGELTTENFSGEAE